MNLICLKDVLARLDSVLDPRFESGLSRELCVNLESYGFPRVFICASVNGFNVETVWLRYGTDLCFDLLEDGGFSEWWYLLSPDAFQDDSRGLVRKYVNSLRVYGEEQYIVLSMNVNSLMASPGGGGLMPSKRVFKVVFAPRSG
jgi:hypothetical protein